MILIIISFIAFITSVISLFPQIYKTYQSKSADDISLFMLINFLICSISWTMYGVLTFAVPIWFTNIIVTFCSLWMIFLKLKYSEYTKE